MKKILVATLSAATFGLSATSAVLAADEVNRPAMNDGNRTGTTTPPAPTMPATDPQTERSGSVGQYVDDATVTVKVKAELALDEVTKARNIGVDTVKGVVTLSGEVESQAEIDRAEAVARGVEGVARVSNKLTVNR